MKREEYIYEELFREDPPEDGQRALAGSFSYTLKEIRAGDQLELEIYPEFSREQIPEELRGRRKDNSQAQRDLNDKNARKYVERLIHANFGRKDLHVSVTYDADHEPKDMRDAQRQMRNYIRRIETRRKRLGLPKAKYVYVTEHNEEAKIRWHHHMIIDGLLDRDTLEELWTAGKRTKTQSLEPDEYGLTGLAKYITKDKVRAKGQRRWSSSKGLAQPEIRRMKTKRPFPGQMTLDLEEKRPSPKPIRTYVRAMITDADQIAVIAGRWHPDYIFTDSEIKYNERNGQFYIWARMRRREKWTSGSTSKRTRRRREDYGDTGATSLKSYETAKRLQEQNSVKLKTPITARRSQRLKKR